MYYKLLVNQSELIGQWAKPHHQDRRLGGIGRVVSIDGKQDTIEIILACMQIFYINNDNNIVYIGRHSLVFTR